MRSFLNQLFKGEDSTPNKTIKLTEKENDALLIATKLLSSLPIEILASILYFTNYVTVTHARRVNKQFKSATEHSMLDNFWKKTGDFFYPNTFSKNHAINPTLTHHKNFIDQHKRIRGSIDNNRFFYQFFGGTLNISWLRIAKQDNLIEFKEKMEKDRITLDNKIIFFLIESMIGYNCPNILKYIFNLACNQYIDKKTQTINTKRLVDFMKFIDWAVCCNQVDVIEKNAFKNIDTPIMGDIFSSKVHDWTGLNPLGLATRLGYTKMVRLLINKQNANVNYQHNLVGYHTPLQIACIYSQYEIAKILIDNNATIDAYYYDSEDDRPRTALSFACQYSDSQDFITYLLNKDANEYNLSFELDQPIPILLIAAQSEKSHAVLALLRHITYDDTMIMHALNNTKSDLIKYLLLHMQLLQHNTELSSNIDASNNANDKMKMQQKLKANTTLLNALVEKSTEKFFALKKADIQYDQNIYNRLSALDLQMIWDNHIKAYISAESYQDKINQP